MQLVICEKPSVGTALAKALGMTERKDGYIEGDNVIVSWCIGHLVELANADVYDERYRVMTAIKPNISVHQINQYLGSIGKKPWTKTNVTCELPQFG